MRRGSPRQGPRRWPQSGTRRRAGYTRWKRGGAHARQPLDEAAIMAAEVGEDIVALDEAVVRLAEHYAVAAALVNLRFFAGLTSEQAAEARGISPHTADRAGDFAGAFLLK